MASPASPAPTPMYPSRVTGMYIAEAVLSKLEEWQVLYIPADDMRGQGYDGVKSMSSDGVESQAVVRQHAGTLGGIHTL